MITSTTATIACCSSSNQSVLPVFYESAATRDSGENEGDGAYLERHFSTIAKEIVHLGQGSFYDRRPSRADGTVQWTPSLGGGISWPTNASIHHQSNAAVATVGRQLAKQQPPDRHNGDSGLLVHHRTGTQERQQEQEEALKFAHLSLRRQAATPPRTSFGSLNREHPRRRELTMGQRLGRQQTAVPVINTPADEQNQSRLDQIPPNASSSGGVPVTSGQRETSTATRPRRPVMNPCGAGQWPTRETLNGVITSSLKGDHHYHEYLSRQPYATVLKSRANHLLARNANMPSFLDRPSSNLTVGGRLASNFKDGRRLDRELSPCKQILEACASFDQMQKAQTRPLAEILVTPRLVRSSKFRQQTNSPQASTPLLQKRQQEKNGSNYCQVDEYWPNGIGCSTPSSYPASPIASRTERALPFRSNFSDKHSLPQSPIISRKPNVGSLSFDPPPPTPEEAEDCLAAHLRGICHEPLPSRTRNRQNNEPSPSPQLSVREFDARAARFRGSTDVLANFHRSSQQSISPSAAMPSNRPMSRPTSAAPPPPSNHQSHHVQQQHARSSSGIRQSQESLMSLMSTSTTSMAVAPGFSRVQQHAGSSVGSQSPSVFIRGPSRHSHHYGANYQNRAAPSSCGSSSRDSSEFNFNIAGQRRNMYRRSARNLNVRMSLLGNESAGGKTAGNQKSRNISHLSPDLRPLPFEVPCVESSSYTSTIFVGRDWIFHELYEILVKASSPEYGMKGAVVYGGVGTGKTAVVHQLASYSPFLVDGEHADAFSQESPSVSPFCSNGSPSSDRVAQGSNDGQPRNRTSNSTDSGFVSGSKLSLNNKNMPTTPLVPIRNASAHPPPRPPLPDWHRSVCQAVVAYHFCQIENQVTCMLPDFLRNMAAMFACAPQLVAYREYFAEQPKLKRLLAVDELLRNPVRSFQLAVTEPLLHLRKCGKIGPGNLLILIDGLDEAEFHRPEFGDSIGSFLVKHGVLLFPDWMKLVLTVKTSSVELLKGLALHKISLDDTVIDEWVFKDSKEYIRLRIGQSSNIQTNINSTRAPSSDNVQASATGSTTDVSSSCPLSRFAAHLASGSKGNFLYMKLTLNLIEKNYLVMKGTNYKVLPINLAEVFLLMFNLRFPTARSFERVAPILNVVLASLRPLAEGELYEAVAASTTNEYMTKDDFYERLKVLDDYLVKKQDGTLVLFHPAFRDWLVRREDGQSPKYLCDLRYGHALLALRLSRLGRHLSGDEMQELGHHALKAHIFRRTQKTDAGDGESNSISALFGRDCQLLWLNQVAADLRSSLCTRRNACFPNSKVSRLLLLAGASADAQLINFCLDDVPDQKIEQSTSLSEYATADIGSTPLLCSAAFYGQQEFALLLLEFGADVGLTESFKGRSPLMLAAAEGHLDMVQTLHQHGAKLSQIDNNHWCALVHAAERGHVNVVSFLLQCDWNEALENRSSNGNGRNHMATSTYGCALRQQAAQQAFVIAAGAGRTSVCEFLLDFGDVLVDEADPVSGETALSTACESARKETVGYLLNRAGARAAYGRQPGKPTPPLLQAVANGCWEIVSTLLARHIDIDAERNGSGQTALMIAAQFGHIAVLELLLSRSVDVSAVDDDGRTALYWTCLKDQPSVANMLLDRGAMLDTFDKHGFGPVHYAAQHGSKQLMQLLLDRCPQLLETPTNSSSRLRPLDLAILADNIDAVQRCLKKGAKLAPSTWTFARDKLSMIAALLNKLLEDGQLLYKRNRLDDAQHRFTYALKKMPQPPATTGASESYTSQWIEFKPDFDRLKFNLQLNYARCQRKKGEPDKAADTCTEAIRNYQQALLTLSSSHGGSEESLVDAYVCRARCLCELRKFDKAAEDLRRALRLSPANRDAQQLMPKVKLALENGVNTEVQIEKNKSEINSGSSLSVYTPAHSSRESSLPVVTDSDIAEPTDNAVAASSSISPNRSQASSDSGNMPDIDNENSTGRLI